MLLLRYFVFAGAMLLGCFWALDAINGPSAPKARQGNVASLQGVSSIQAWRAAEARKQAITDGRDTSAALILPSIATMAPTAERLAYERQIASNTLPAPVAMAESARSPTDARAELTETAPAHLDAVPAQSKPKARRKVASKAVVATAQPRSPNSEFGGFLFGRIFEN